MEDTAVFDRLNPPLGRLNVLESIDCAMSTVELIPSLPSDSDTWMTVSLLNIAVNRFALPNDGLFV